MTCVYSRRPAFDLHEPGISAADVSLILDPQSRAQYPLTHLCRHILGLGLLRKRSTEFIENELLALGQFQPGVDHCNIGFEQLLTDLPIRHRDYVARHFYY